MVQGNVNLAHRLTKMDSQLTEVLHLSMFSGRLCLDVENEPESKQSRNHIASKGRSVNIMMNESHILDSKCSIISHTL